MIDILDSIVALLVTIVIILSAHLGDKIETYTTYTTDNRTKVLFLAIMRTPLGVVLYFVASVSVPLVMIYGWCYIKGFEPIESRYPRLVPVGVIFCMLVVAMKYSCSDISKTMTNYDSDRAARGLKS